MFRFVIKFSILESLGWVVFLFLQVWGLLGQHMHPCLRRPLSLLHLIGSHCIVIRACMHRGHCPPEYGLNRGLVRRLIRARPELNQDSIRASLEHDHCMRMCMHSIKHAQLRRPKHTYIVHRLETCHGACFCSKLHATLAMYAWSACFATAGLSQAVPQWRVHV